MRRPIARHAVALLAAMLLAPSAEAQRGAERRAGAGAAAARVTRLPNGAPGPGYWQQQVDYALEATLEPASRRLTGRGTIVYHNNSPDALGELRWHLYQNIFRGADAGASIVGRSMTPTRGITVTRVAAAGVPLAQAVSGTLMRTPLPRPIRPGDSLTLSVEWTLDVPAVASLRTGSEGEDFGMAQWYPQISAYDDVHGWNDLPYLGQGEFYLEYGNWDVRLTLPRRFVVAATGTLENPDAVLTPAQATALRGVASAPAGQLTRVVAAADTGGRGLADGATRSWHFTAQRVRDFAWAASPRFQWNATRTAPLASQPGGVLIHSFFPPAAATYYDDSWAVARGAIEFFSARFGDYVYPQATVVSGPVVGMEYPMLVFQGVESDVINMPENVTVHELGHEWYPMMIGSNETRHAFMDEGFNTFIEMEWFRARYGAGGFWSARMPAWVRGLLGPGDHRRWTYESALKTVPAMNAVGALFGKPPRREVPLMTSADSIPAEQLGVVAYQKPGAVLVMLRDVVGDSVFHAALREYYARWLYKHPYPDDFFNTVESVAGRDLDWFWRPWFHESRPLDLALGDVRSEGAGGAWTARLTLRNAGQVEMPATVRLALGNGAVRTFRARPAPGTTLPLVVAGLPAAVRGAEVDAEHLLYDVNRGNNVWPAEARPAAGALLGVTGRGFLALVASAAAAAVLVRAAGLWDGVRLSGFSPARFAVGPFSLWTATRGFHLRRIPRPRLYGAGVLAVPPTGATTAELARGTASLVSAGPLASLLAAVVLFPIVYVLDRRFDAGLRPHGNLLLDSALVLTIVAALLAFVRALRPRRSRGAYIPNAPWVRLLARSGTPEMQRWSAMRAVTAESFAGIRPRGWNADWIRQAAALDDGSAAEAGACMLAYLWALDRGDAPEAGAFLERAAGAAARRRWRFRVRRHVNAECAFFAAYVEGDAAEGARLMAHSTARRAPVHVRRRARAAVLIGEGDLTRASIEARSGLAADARTEAWGGTGIATFERYWLAVLLAAADRRGGAAVVTPTVGSLAVLIGDPPKRRWGFAR